VPNLVEVSGGRELRAALRKAAGDLDALKDAHVQVARVVATEAKRQAPKKSGKLSDTVRPLAGQRYARVAVGNNRKTASGVPYAGPIHWGWPRSSPKLKRVKPQYRTYTITQNPEWFISPNPFVVEAAQATEPIWQRIYLGALDEIVETIANSSNGTGP
jgi:hypothetical protein